MFAAYEPVSIFEEQGAVLHRRLTSRDDPTIEVLTVEQRDSDSIFAVRSDRQQDYYCQHRDGHSTKAATRHGFARVEIREVVGKSTHRPKNRA